MTPSTGRTLASRIRRLAVSAGSLALAASLAFATPAFAASSDAAVPSGPMDSIPAPVSALSQASSREATASVRAAVDESYWAWPVPSLGVDHISQGFEGHGALDIWGAHGTEIVASRAGVVSSVETTDYLDGYGICVVIYHYDGTSTLYGHLSSRIVEPGMEVQAGQVIGYMGSTGWSTGDHLHFEIITGTREGWIWDGIEIDPYPHVVTDGVANPVPAGELEEGCYWDVDYDDPGCWYAPYVREATDRGLMSGSSGLFRPEEQISRGEVFTVIYRAATGATAQDAPAGINTTPLVDNAPGQYCTAALNWAYAQGILRPSDNQARPDDAITREELATIMQRYAANVRGADVSADLSVLFGAADFDSVSEWARASLAWTATHDILSGRVQADGTTLLAPAEAATRAEMAKIVVTTLRTVG